MGCKDDVKLKLCTSLNNPGAIGVAKGGEGGPVSLNWNSTYDKNVIKKTLFLQFQLLLAFFA